MTRNCPICDSPNSAELYSQSFSDGTAQDVVSCTTCGFCYASVSPPVDYDLDSKYAVVESIGSGENPRERRRQDQIAQLITDILPRRDSSILDIGCARGGMLEALRRAGYTRVIGMDPSANCVAACRAKGLDAYQGSLQDQAAWRYDFVILSHVLEHVWDVRAALRGVRDRLQPEGQYYIEVPNALRYVDYLAIPFLDFNREHVNHFSLDHLRDALDKAGLHLSDRGERELETPHGRYPAIWAVGGIEHGRPRGHWTWPDDGKLRRSLLKYVDQSGALLERMEGELAAKLDGHEKVILWGYGEFAQQLLRTRTLQRLQLEQVIDHDPRKQGQLLGDVPVEMPWQIRYEYPILVASIVNREGIMQDARKLGLRNPVVTL